MDEGLLPGVGALLLIAAGAAACTFNVNDYRASSTSGAGGKATSSSSATSVSSSSSSSGSGSTVGSSSSSTGGGCSDESGPAPPPCAMLTDDFAGPADMTWLYTAPSSISGGHALAVSNAAVATSTFALDTALHPAFPLKECWMSVAIDMGDAGDNTRAFVDWVGTYKLHITISKSNLVADGGSSYPTPFKGILRLREHNGCLHVETAHDGDMTWTSITGHVSQPWIYMPGHVEFGITQGDGQPRSASFSKFSLPPSPL